MNRQNQIRTAKMIRERLNEADLVAEVLSRKPSMDKVLSGNAEDFAIECGACLEKLSAGGNILAVMMPEEVATLKNVAKMYGLL